MTTQTVPGASPLNTVLEHPTSPVHIGSFHRHIDGNSCGTVVPCAGRDSFEPVVVLVMGSPPRAMFLGPDNAEVLATFLKAHAKRAKKCGELPVWPERRVS
jgi:hypothetical protein